MKDILLMVIFFVAVFCTGCEASNSYKKLTADEALKIIQTEKNIVILDVRTQEEYNKRHISNAVLLPVDNIRNGDFGTLDDKNQKILIYCHTGRRAGDAAQILADNGYTNVFSFGGIVDWIGEVEGTDIND